MVIGEKCEIVNRHAVRIALNSQDKLIGSGVLFLRQIGENPLLFTAAHVIYPLLKNPRNIILYLSCLDGSGNTQSFEVSIFLVKNHMQRTEREGESYIHPQYKEIEKVKGYQYQNDAAIIVLPWKSWMETLERFCLKEELTGEELRGWGFPESMDCETQKEMVSILVGKKEIRGTIDNKEGEKFSFSYQTGPWERNITREGYMRGFSGCGLFSIKNDCIALKGIISSECGDRTAGTMLWASSSSLFIWIMEYFELKVRCPSSFEYYKEMVAKKFLSTRKDARRYFCDWSEELIEDCNLLPEAFYSDTEIDLPCESNRKFCDFFWMGQLKKAVILYGIENISVKELTSPFLKMPNPYEDDLVQMVFLCTEESAESVIGEMVEKDYFAECGKMKNGTVFVLNSKEDNENMHILFTRYECRQVVCNITADYSSRKLKMKTCSLLPDENEENDFDIVRGKVSQCNLAAIGIDEMMKPLNRAKVNEKIMKQEIEDILRRVWEV